MEYRLPEVPFDLHGLRDSPGYADAEVAVVDTLERQGVLDPATWVLNMVARRLSEAPPLAPVTDDFITFVLEHNFGELLLENLRTAAPPHVAEKLRLKGLLPDLETLEAPF